MKEYYSFPTLVPNIIATSLLFVVVGIDSMLEPSGAMDTKIWLVSTLEVEGIVLGTFSVLLLVGMIVLFAGLANTLTLMLFWNHLIAHVANVNRLRLGQSYLVLLCFSWIGWVLSL